jgi:aerobic-type carbon monoxide dehydrogenase small subunit (CoxS/CutS family)
VRSCQVPIGQLEGSFVTTIEALSRDRSHPVQQAWVAESVPQCGYCQSGMIMAAAACSTATPRRAMPRSTRRSPTSAAAAPIPADARGDPPRRRG